ncbi:MAG: hypothetical protein WBY53_07895 [Acidobacteriaceae bacterium]
MTDNIVATIHASDTVIDRASGFLLSQSDQQFPEVRHGMRFGRAAGFTCSNEEQSGDIFARAMLANLLLDIADLAPADERYAELPAIAVREAEYVASCRLQDRAGGWSYFPDLPELPPDADSLAAAICLFARIAPQYLELCRAPVELVLAGAALDGSFETWIVAPTDSPQDRARMQWGIQNCWGTGTDVDVLAHFYHALQLWDPICHRAAITRGIRKLLDLQQSDGSWNATWYDGPAYGTGLALRLLRESDSGASASERARQFFIRHQNSEGLWGNNGDTSLQTALSLNGLHETGLDAESNQWWRSGAALCDLQLPDGSWPASPWIKMEIGRATGKTLHVATYQSATITTAFCLRALLSINLYGSLRG